MLVGHRRVSVICEGVVTLKLSVFPVMSYFYLSRCTLELNLPLPFWQLLLALLALLFGLRLLAWWAWSVLVLGGTSLSSRTKNASGLRALAAKFQQRWPRLYQWLEGRFSIKSFTGLPLTLMLVFAAYLLVLGGGLLEDLFEDQDLTQLDQAINQGLNILRDPTFLALFGWITALANNTTLSAITLVSVGFLWAHGRKLYIPGLLLSIIGSQAITWLGKFAIARERPDFITFASAASPSFPSAHATGAIAVYGFIAYAIARDLAGVRRRFELGYWAIALIAMIALSRMVLSVHYASDIAAGLMVGAFWLLAGFALTEYLRERAKRENY